MIHKTPNELLEEVAHNTKIQVHPYTDFVDRRERQEPSWKVSPDLEDYTAIIAEIVEIHSNELDLCDQDASTQVDELESELKHEVGRNAGLKNHVQELQENEEKLKRQIEDLSAEKTHYQTRHSEIVAEAEERILRETSTLRESLKTALQRIEDLEDDLDYWRTGHKCVSSPKVF
jgi:chromosome segregation ATPase